MYDEIFEVALPEEIELIGFVDDVAIIGENVDFGELVHKMNNTLD